MAESSPPDVRRGVWIEASACSVLIICRDCGYRTIRTDRADAHIAAAVHESRTHPARRAARQSLAQHRARYGPA